MNKINVVIINKSTCVTNEALKMLLPALQKQVTEHLSPAWNLPGANLSFMEGNETKVMDDAQVLYILDNTDQATILGYHDLLPNGKPFGKVFAATDIEYGEDWRTTVSHELCELLCDPLCTSICIAEFAGRVVSVFKECCDAVEAQSYEIDGQKVSNFVFPTFFDTFSSYEPGTKFDFMGNITAPMTIAQGGYLSINDVSKGIGWKTVFGQSVPWHKRLPPNGSRRERFYLRMNNNRQWQRSSA